MVNNKKLREGRKITQDELANAVLVSRTMIAHIERGSKQPSVDILQSIAAYFNCSLDNLVIPHQREDTAYGIQGGSKL